MPQYYISESIKEPSFYTLPIANLCSILSKTSIKNPIDYTNILLDMIPNTIKEHQDDSALLLQNINADSLSLNDCINVIKSFANLSVCKRFGFLYEKEVSECDIRSQLNQKEEEIQRLKKILDDKDFPYQTESDKALYS